MSLTSKYAARLEETERRKSLVDRYIPIVDGAGYIDGTLEMTPEDVYFLAGTIMHDREVAKLARTPEFENRTGGIVDPDFVGVLNSMTDEERAALRSRLNFQPSTILRGGPTR